MATAGAALGLALAAAGCGTPPWQASTSPTPTVTASATPAPSASNDLARGSLKRSLTAGAAKLEVNYWSTLDLAQWTPELPKPLNIVVSGTLQGGAKGQQVFLSAVRVATIATGALPPPGRRGPRSRSGSGTSRTACPARGRSPKRSPEPGGCGALRLRGA